MTYTVHAHWDAESGTWWTDGEDLPGLRSTRWPIGMRNDYRRDQDDPFPKFPGVAQHGVDARRAPEGSF
jgi:hypothetical protein